MSKLNQRKLFWCVLERDSEGTGGPLTSTAARLGQEWRCRAGIDLSDGTVFAPVAIAGESDDDQREVLSGLWRQGEFVPFELVTDDGELFVPTTWLARKCPTVADICALIEGGVRELATTVPPDEE